MTQSRITYDERLRHIEAVRRVAAEALAPLDRRARKSAHEVHDFVVAHIETLPRSVERLSVAMAVDYIATGSRLSTSTVKRALRTLEAGGLLIVVRRPSSRGGGARRAATVYRLPTGWQVDAAALPPVGPNYWATPEGRAYRLRAAGSVAEEVAEDRRDRDVSTRTSTQSPTQGPTRSSGGFPHPKSREDYSLRSPAVGGADGLGASGTTALPPRSDGDGDAGTTSDAITTDPRQAVDAGPGRPAEHDAQRRADTERVAPPNDNPWLALREQALARRAAETSGDAA